MMRTSLFTRTACWSSSARLGPRHVHTGHRCLRVEQGEAGATVHFARQSDASPLPPVQADVVVACDGVNSAVRRQFYPHEQVAFAGINTWRGVTRHRPILSGKSYLRVGSIDTGKMVIYPIVDNLDGSGLQLVNWVAEIQRPDASMNDWNQGGRVDDFIDIFASWRFDWLDVPALIRGADQILEYPMVDRDPVAQWTFGRVTLLGDAAHPMYPRGSNGSAQALIDARTLGVAVWEKKLATTVEKAIRDSGLGLNPMSMGELIRIPMPPLSEERRRELTKVAKSEGEHARVGVRGLRREANEQLKKLLKDKAVSEDEERRAQDDIQKLTDRYIVEIDKLLSAKEQEIMTI